MELLATTRRPVPLSGTGLCIPGEARLIRAAGSRHFMAGYNQTADGESHNLSVAGAIPAPATIPANFPVKDRQVGTNPERRSL